jgi:hypothetical protein
MKYAVERGSGATMYITKFHKNVFRHSKLNGGRRFIHRHIDSMMISYPYFYFFKIRKVGSKYTFNHGPVRCDC